MPLFVREYLVDTVALSIDESGAYLHLLMHGWIRGGELPDDDRQLAAFAKCSLKKWRPIRVVLEQFYTIESGVWTNKRLTSELQYVRGTFEKRSAAGAKGGRPTREQNQQHSESPAFSEESRAKAPTPTPTPTQEEDDDVGDAGAPARAVIPIVEPPADLTDVLRLTDEVCRAGGVRHVDPGHIARHVAQVREWLASGADPPLILETVRQAVADATEPIHSLKYFDARIRQAVARKEGNLNGRQSHPSNRHRGDGFAQALEREVASLGGRG